MLEPITIWRFARPHTIYGTIASLVGVYILAVDDLTTAALSGVVAITAALAANLYIVGLNQLTDIEIDKINKPELPLAAGKLSLHQGQQLVRAALILSVMLSLWQPWLLLTVGACLAIGTAYSLPPIRLKRFPFWAALCIYTVRGVIVNLGFFAFFRNQVGQSPLPNLALWGLVIFVLLFTFVIALFKDIPDITGDRVHGISTFSLRWGENQVYWLCIAILMALYGAMAIAAVWLQAWYLVVIHVLPLASLVWAQRQLKTTKEFYQFIWKLFYLEYILYPLAFLG